MLMTFNSMITEATQPTDLLTEKQLYQRFLSKISRRYQLLISLVSMTISPTQLMLKPPTQISTVVKYNQYNNMDHYSFMVGKDMSYTQDVLSMLA